jgi:NTE family protein
MPLDKTEQHVALSPVDDDGFSRPRPGVALCLSGGGYRAMIFHLGVLWRLNELGYLARLDRISSVSGARSPPGCWACAGAGSTLPAAWRGGW